MSEPTTLTIAECGDCPWQGNDLFCKLAPPPTVEEMRAWNRAFSSPDPDGRLAEIRGQTPFKGAPPAWCALRTAPMLVQIGSGGSETEGVR